MNSFRRTGRAIGLAAIFGYFAALIGTCCAQTNTAAQATNEIRIVELQGRVEVAAAGTTTWAPARTNQTLHANDRVRSGGNSRGALRLSDQSIVPFDASTELEILPPDASDAQSGLLLIQGIHSFFHRDKPGHIRVLTRGAAAGVEGTEFVLAVNDAGLTTLSVIDGKVRFSGSQGTLVLTNGEQASVEPGAAPVRAPAFVVNNVLQWCFYYPAVLNPGDLPLTDDEKTALADSLAAYRSGDLLAALSRYPAAREPGSDAERVYYAALVLSVGQVEKAEAALESLSAAGSAARPRRVAAALRLLIAAVKRQALPAPPEPALATEFLARSYYEQSRAVRGASLEEALRLAREAVARAPDSGFAHARTAELEFSFGRAGDATRALDRSLALSPRNAQALALKGFLSAAENHPREAITWFDRAIAADPALGNAWLGRGLCRIRRGDAGGGREDLLVAAALEPQRADLRSYLGKAYANAGDAPRAARELQHAKGLDPNDPTPWLYSALMNQESNRVNEAIRDLEKSKELNDNRSVYRSQLLLDQDQAVRSANLASMYKDAGMFDVSVREATRAVNTDYANYSAHLFLANSYNQLRDPNQVNLRYETPAFDEYLVANLLAPVGAGTLSPTISQQEYSPLFSRDRLGVTSSTEYLSRGAWTESGAQFGTFGNSSYSFEGLYHSDPGQQANNDIELRQLSLAFKQQLTAQDSVYFQIYNYKANGGDLAQYYDPVMANTGVRTEETQRPVVTVGYHHEWSPGVHTLFLAARVDDTYAVTMPVQTVPVQFVTAGQINGLRLMNVDLDSSTWQEVYSTELQQIWEEPAHDTIAGARYQWGNLNNRNLQTQPSLAGIFEDPTTASSQHLDSNLERLAVYGYHYWQILDPLLLVGGVSYDYLYYPENFRSPPFTNRQTSIDQFSPKAGLIWTPLTNTTVRAAYTRSLAGASLDQSYRLEPTTVAGLNQAYRSIIPESVRGANAGATFETYGLSLEQRFSTGTYLGLSGELLNSDVTRTVGSFTLDDINSFAYESGLREHLDFKEASLIFTADQLIGNQCAVGARYRFTRARLFDNFVDVPNLPPGQVDPPFQARQDLQSDLNQLNFHANWNHPSGLFAGAEAVWYLQHNTGYSPALPDDDFWQFNLFAGYRFPRRKAELGIGLLNVTDQDYRLNPLTLYNNLPRSRTLAARFQFNF